jgi:hypothetical protein
MRTLLEVSKLVALATCVGVTFASVSMVAAPRGEWDRTTKTTTKAPREGSTEVACACSSTAELDAIRSCICYIRSLLGDAANDTVVPCMTTLDQINEADITIISWLKTIYAADLGYAAVPCEEA